MFEDREEAGLRLARFILSDKSLKGAEVIAIPRGGVVVAKVISDIAELPMSALVVKKIPSPHNPELAIGATGPPVGGDGIVFWDEEIVSDLGLSEVDKNHALKKTIESVREKEKSLNLTLPKVFGKPVIVVDDGVATGSTAVAAGLILKKLGAAKIVLATPVIAKHTKREISKYFDKIISVVTPANFQAVGQFYREFPQVEDEEVKRLLRIST